MVFDLVFWLSIMVWLWNQLARFQPLTIQTFSLQNLREHGSPDRCNSDPGYGGQTPVLLHQPPLRLPMSLRGWKVHMGWWDTSGKVAKYNNLRIQKKFFIVQCTMCTFTYKNGLFLTLGSGTSSAWNENLRPLLNRNIPLISGKYGLRNHFWPGHDE